MARIYVTYRHNDLELARKLVDALRRRGRHHVTIDVDHLVLGQEWRRALDDAFRAADGLVVLLTENSVDAKEGHISSHYIAADIGRAMASGKVVMPIILKPARIPDLVRDIHCEFMKEQKDADISSMVEKIEQGLEKHRSSVGHESQSLVPEGFRHLTENVRNFYEDTPFDRAVFVMMKFPDSQMKDVHRKLLNDIWRVVRDTLEKRGGLKALRADQRAYHDQLWENVCVHMIGSKYGLAVLEDRVASELNPNLTLEYGFMRALNREVGLLRDASFQHDRADLTGKLSQSFTIGANDVLDEASLETAIHDWLSGSSLRLDRPPS